MHKRRLYVGEKFTPHHLYTQTLRDVNMGALKSKAGPKGRVAVRVYGADGALVEIYKGRNLVVQSGREACAILAGSGDTDKIVSEMQFGTDDTPTNMSDTGVTSGFPKALDSVAYPTAGTVRYVGALETSENNGVTVKEVGLFCADGTLFARYVIGSIAKTAGIRVEITWDVTF